jgi:hypothetical protein
MMQEPQLAQTDPKLYYLWLKSQGMSPMQAVQMVEQRFGPPKSDEQINKENAKQQQNNALAQTAGMVGGVVAGRYIIDKAGAWIDKLTGAKVTEDVVKNAAKQTGESLTSGAQGTSQAATQGTSEFGKYFTPVDPSKIPAGQTVPDGMTAIRSNVDGSVQVVPTESLNDSTFLSDINWGKFAQGAGGVLQLYQAYNAAKSGDYAGAGIYGVAGGANLATSGALGASAASGAGSALGGYLVPGANILAGAYGGYKTAEALGDMAAGTKRTQTGVMGGAASGAAIGAGVGSIVPGIGTGIGAAIGAVVGATAGAVGSWTGSSKGKAQFMRDNIRGVLQEGGVLDDKFQGTLADGSKYDFGKDGSTLKWKNVDKIAEAQPKAWNAAVPLTDALATAYGFVGQKASDISAWYAKGAVSNAGDDANTAIKNAQHFAKQQGITLDMIKARLDEALKDNRINQNQYDYYIGGARQLTSGVTPQVGPKGPAPLPQQPAPAPQPEQPVQQQGKLSVRELLERNMQKK